ncbi:13803_t:CDS:2, partial [Racocetra fulgida]
MPKKLNFPKPSSVHNKKFHATRFTNFHTLLCKDHKCSYHTLEHYYETYSKSESEEKPLWVEPKIDASIFHISARYKASFKKLISTTTLDQLATKAEEKTCADNQVSFNKKQR